MNIVSLAKSSTLILLSISLFSCGSLRIAEDKNSKNLKDVGIEWDYSEKVDDRFQPMIDSTINSAIAEFNNEKHLFTVHKKKPKDKDFVSIEFTKGKIAGKGEKIAG